MKSVKQAGSTWTRLLLGVAALAGSSSGAGAGDAATPRCALVIADTSPVATLLEARLLGRRSESWLERSAIEQVLAEQQLQAAFGAGGGEDRMALGQLLKADVLVLLRTGTQNKQPYAELVVAETQGGLRLLARSAALTSDPEADAASLIDLLNAALAKYRESIREVYAIPPFVSQDLSNEFDHLKAAFAKVLEQALAARPGILVVELAEADALAREYKLTAQDERPRRRLPLYLLGEYRHEGLADARQLTISLQVKRGGRQLNELKQTMPPTEGAAYLRQVATALIDGGDASDVPPDVETEALELAARAHAFLTLGNWAEAMALQEASLLLKPHQPELRCEAVRSALELARLAVQATNDYVDTVRLRCRAFQHCQEIYRTDEAATFAVAMSLYSDFGLIYQSSSFDHLRGSPAVPEGTFLQLEGLIREEARLLEDLSDRQRRQAEWAGVRFPPPQAHVELPHARYAASVDHILAHQGEFDSAQKRALFGSRKKTVERRQFLQTLVAHADLDDEIRSLARNALKRMDEEADWGAFPATPQRPPDGKKAGGLTFRPIQVWYPGQAGKHRVSSAKWLALDAGVDLFWGTVGAFFGGSEWPLYKLMGTSQEPVVVCNRVSWSSKPMYDGQYVWFTNGNRELWLVDPATDESWQIGPEHGIPGMIRENAPERLRPTATAVVPYRVGEAIVAGEMGKAWLARVKISRDGNHDVRVFHEAKEALPTGAERDAFKRVQSEVYQKAWRNPRIACQFRENWLLTIEDESGTPAPRVLFSRTLARNANPEFAYHPLVVNPDDMSVTVFEDSFSGGIVHNGMCHFAQYVPHADAYQLMRAGLPNYEPEVVIPTIPAGDHYLRENTLHIVGKEWSQADLSTGEVTSYGEVPWKHDMSRPRRSGEIELDTVSYSNRYGWVVSCQELDGGAVLAQVLFDGSGMTLKEAVHVWNEPAADTPLSTSRVLARRAPRKEVLWETNGWRCCNDLAYSPDGKLIITASSHGPCVQAWDAATGLLIADLLEHSGSMKTVVFDRSGKYFATAGSEHSMFLWSTEDLSLLHHVEGTDSGVGDGPSLAFSWDSRLLASGSYDRNLLASGEMRDVITVWDTKDGNEVVKIADQEEIPREVEFTPDGHRLVAFGEVPETELWNLETRRPAGRIETIHRPLGYLPGGELLAIASNLDRSLIAWDFGTNDVRVLWQRSPRNVAAVSRDGRYLLEVWGAFPKHMKPSCRRLTVWDIAARRKVATSETAINAGRWIFSPDGKTLVAVDMLGTLWRWDLTRRPATEQMRTWTDVSGQFSAEATFEDFSSQGVRLKRKDGRSVLVPLKELSAQDREFLCTIPTAELSPAGPSPCGGPLEPGDGWIGDFGEPIDPDGDCTFTLDRWKMIIGIPGSHHDLSAEIGKMNAPRVVQSVDCDFLAEVQVDAGFDPKNAVAKGQVSYQGAGIVVMQDEQTYLRIELAAVRHPGQKDVGEYVHLEFRRNGVVPPDGKRVSWIPGARITHVGVLRRGSEFIPFAQGLGTGTVNLPMIRLLLPAQLTVGLAAINVSSEPFAPQFQGYRLEQAKH